MAALLARAALSLLSRKRAVQPQPFRPHRRPGPGPPCSSGAVRPADHSWRSALMGSAWMRGFLAAYQATTGRQAWRFWTVPKPGEPPAETWDGKAIETGGGATWLTGSYDAETGRDAKE
jgi:hypothetical protein